MHVMVPTYVSIPSTFPFFQAKRNQHTLNTNYHLKQRAFSDLVSRQKIKYNGIWFHSHREVVMKRIYVFTEEQTARLLDLLQNEHADGSICP
jgi:hypothetical protein